MAKVASTSNRRFKQLSNGTTILAGDGDLRKVRVGHEYARTTRLANGRRVMTTASGKTVVTQRMIP